jgi:hypothetical protein
VLFLAQHFQTNYNTIGFLEGDKMSKKDQKCCEGNVCSKNSGVVFKVPEEIPPVTGVRPCGAQVLLELLTVQEMMGTKLILKNNTQAHAEYQAYVIAAGPTIDLSIYGFKVGDRVLLSGNGTPVPNYDNTERERILMDPFAIKAVLT